MMIPLVKRRRNIIILVFSVVVVLLSVYFILGLASLKLGSRSYNNGDYPRARAYYQFAKMFPFVTKRAEDRLTVLNRDMNPIPEILENMVTIPIDSIKFQNSFVFKGAVENYSNSKTDPPDLYRRYLLGTILKNTSDYGIPVVNIKKLNMYDATGKLVMTVDNPAPNVLLVKDGETPFTYYFDLRESHGISIKSFSVDLEIPPFVPNPNAVRLSVVKQTLISKAPATEGSTQYRYKYQLTLKNQTDSVVSDVYRITLLKYNGVPLTRIGHACCFNLDITNVPVKAEGVLRAEDLDRNNQNTPVIFQPGELKTITFEMLTDEVFDEFKNQFQFNPDLVESIIYIVGTKEIK